MEFDSGSNEQGQIGNPTEVYSTGIPGINVVAEINPNREIDLLAKLVNHKGEGKKPKSNVIPFPTRRK